MTDVKQDMKEMSSQVLGALATMNKVMYDMPAQIGIAKKITHQEDQFQAQSYTGGEMLLIAQTGSAFVDPHDSWLKFSTTINTGANTSSLSFGVGSMANFIDEILIESRTGKDVCRVRAASVFIKNWQDWTHSPSWKATEAIAQLYPPKTTFDEGAATPTPVGSFAGTTTPTMCLRLSDLAPCFRPIGGKLLPPQFMEGLRIRLILKTGLALGPQITVVNPAVTYTINNPRVMWKVCELDDPFKRKVQEIASTRGLVVLFKDIHQQNGSSTSAYDNTVNKAVSNALRAYVVPRLVDDIGGSGTVLNVDPNTSQVFNWKTAQSRIGNDYFPQKALVSSATSDFREFYTYCLHSMGYDNPQYAPVVQPVATAGGYGSAVATNSKSIMIFNYNKSAVNDLDGYVLNNSRALIFDFTTHTPEANGVRYDTFVEYLAIAIVFNSNIDIKI